MVRSHSVCPDGIERFSDNLITITSCTNHSGAHNNDAVLMVVQKKLIISPKIIKPLPQNQGSVHWMDISSSNISPAANSSVRRERTPPRKKQGGLSWWDMMEKETNSFIKGNEKWFMKTESKKSFRFGKLFPKKIGKLYKTINNKKWVLPTPYISLIKYYL